MGRIKVKHAHDSNSVKVVNKSTASLTGLADDSRELSDKQFKMLIKLANEYRRADNHAAKWVDSLDDLVGKARTLSNKEWRRAIKLAKTLRSADAEIERSQKLEQGMRETRFRQSRY